jgi:DNA-directed RNA polymerase specialized sigma24 family protein
VQVVDASGETQFFNRVEDEGEMAELWEQEWREAVLRQCLEEIRREFDAKTLEAFELFAWKGKSAQEVGEKLDMSANAVFLVKHRVMKRIKALVPKMEEVF